MNKADQALRLPSRIDVRRHLRNIDIVVPILASFLAALTTLWATAQTMVVKFDSIYYLSTAENLARGNGLIDYNGDQLTNFPPGFPLLIRFVMLFGLDSVTATRVIAVFSSISLVLLVAYVASHIGPRRSSAVAAVTIMALPAVIVMHSQAMSEPVFTVFVLALVAGLLRLEPAPAVLTMRDLAPLIIASWLCCLVRYQGYAVLIATALVLALRPNTWRQRFALVTKYALSAGLIVVTIIGQTRARSDSIGMPETDARGSIGSDVRRGLTSLGEWISGSARPLSSIDIRDIGVVIVVAVVAATGYALWRMRTNPMMRPVIVVILFLVMIPLFTFVSARRVWVEMTPRMIFPFFPLVVILLAVALVDLATRTKALGRSVIATFGCAVLLIGATQTWERANHYNSTTRGLNSDQEQSPELGAVVAELDVGAVIYANNSEGIWLSSRRDIVKPFGLWIQYVEGAITDGFDRGGQKRRRDRINMFLDDLCTGFYLAMTDWVNPGRPGGALRMIEDFSAITPIEVVGDGKLFFVESADPNLCTDESVAFRTES